MNVAPKSAFWLVVLMGGCFLNSVVLEMLMKYVSHSSFICSHSFKQTLTLWLPNERLDKGGGALMTLAQFLVVAILMLPLFLRFKDPETGSFRIHLYSAAPMKEYALQAAIFFVSSVASNKAFELGVSQPFNVIFRSLSLLVSYIIGALWFGRRYSKQQLLAVILVTLGVLVTTLGEVLLKSGVELKPCCDDMQVWVKAYYWVVDPARLDPIEVTKAYSFEELFWFAVSIFLLSLTLLGLAILGQMQGKSYRIYKCQPEENMFYLHLLSLPLFTLISGDLREHITLWNGSEPFSILGIVNVPWLWWLMLLNALTQVLCLLGVHNTTSSMGTLACTFATTVRKFITLIFSVLYFQSPFTSIHGVGALVVFVGTYLFATAPTESSEVKVVGEKEKRD